MTIAQAATSSLVRSTSGIVDDVRQEDRNRQADEPSTGSSRDDTFASLVETLLVSESDNVTDIASSLPSEMFEEDGQSTIEKQRADSEAKYRDQALSGLSDARFDRSSLQARLDTANKAANQPEAKAKLGTASSLTAKASVSSTSGNASISQSDQGTNEALKIVDTQTQRAAGMVAETNANNDATGSNNIDLTASRNAAAISTTASSAAGGVISSAGRSGVSLAEQIGQLLGSQRSGESAGARALSSAAVVAPSDAGQAGSNRAQDAAGSRVSTKEDQAGSSKPVEEPTNSDFSKLVRSLRMQAGERQSSARLLLRPPELGRVIVDVRMDGDTIQIDVQAETEEGRQLLSERAAQLRLALEDAGVVLDRLNVVMSDQPANVEDAGRYVGTPRPGDRLADTQVNAQANTLEEEFEPWQEQPEELMAATIKAARRRLGFSDRARLDVRA